MRRVHRLSLSQATLDRLSALTRDVGGHADPRARAAALWQSKPRATFQEIRDQLERMASGRARCMYCEDSLGTDIDHFRPKTDYPQATFEWSNYLLACGYCNSNAKRTAFPVDAEGTPLLIDPTVEDPAEHILFSFTTGEFVAVGRKGAESIRVFGLNDDRSPRRLPSGRSAAVVSLIALIKDYDAHAALDPAWASRIREAMKDHPFSAVLHWLVRTAASPAGARVLGDSIVHLVQKHEVQTWL